MKTFYVTIPIAGTLTIAMEAENRKAAKDAAWNKYDEEGADAGEIEWEALESISTGNVLHVPCNDVEVSEA